MDLTRSNEFGRRGDGHSGWGGVPHELDFGGSQAVGGVDEVAQLAFQCQSFGSQHAGGGERVGVFIAQSLERGDGQWLGFASQLFDFRDEGVRVQRDRVLQLLARLVDPVFDLQPIEQCALRCFTQEEDTRGRKPVLG